MAFPIGLPKASRLNPLYELQHATNRGAGESIYHNADDGLRSSALFYFSFTVSLAFIPNQGEELRLIRFDLYFSAHEVASHSQLLDWVDCAKLSITTTGDTYNQNYPDKN